MESLTSRELKSISGGLRRNKGLGPLVRDLAKAEREGGIGAEVRLLARRHGKQRDKTEVLEFGDFGGRGGEAEVLGFGGLFPRAEAIARV
jgi:hypothetical protein